MNYEIILLTGFGMTGKLYGYHDEQMDGDNLTKKEMFNGTRVILTFVDTKTTKYMNGKQRRIFDLKKMERDNG